MSLPLGHAGLVVCEHLTEQQALLFGTGQHLDICLSQGGGSTFKQKKIYVSPDVLQGFLSGSAQEEQLKTEL